MKVMLSTFPQRCNFESCFRFGYHHDWVSKMLNTVILWSSYRTQLSQRANSHWTVPAAIIIHSWGLKPCLCSCSAYGIHHEVPSDCVLWDTCTCLLIRTAWAGSDMEYWIWETGQYGLRRPVPAREACFPVFFNLSMRQRSSTTC